MATANVSASGGKRWGWALIGVALFLLLWTAASLRIGNPVLLPRPDWCCPDSSNWFGKAVCLAMSWPVCDG